MSRPSGLTYIVEIEGRKVAITVDWQQLARQLGRKASKSKRNRTIAMSGAIAGRIVK